MDETESLRLRICELERENVSIRIEYLTLQAQMIEMTMATMAEKHPVVVAELNALKAKARELK